ncbi:9140_t:CDS:2 [Funneliformis geosporum]|nr:9140_t:CDS:2 [Funneliformis geosporum]
MEFLRVIVSTAEEFAKRNYKNIYIPFMMFQLNVLTIQSSETQAHGMFMQHLKPQSRTEDLTQHLTTQSGTENLMQNLTNQSGTEELLKYLTGTGTEGLTQYLTGTGGHGTEVLTQYLTTQSGTEDLSKHSITQSGTWMLFQNLSGEAEAHWLISQYRALITWSGGNQSEYTDDDDILKCLCLE